MFKIGPVFLVLAMVIVTPAFAEKVAEDAGVGLRRVVPANKFTNQVEPPKPVVDFFAAPPVNGVLPPVDPEPVVVGDISPATVTVGGITLPTEVGGVPCAAAGNVCRNNADGSLTLEVFRKGKLTLSANYSKFYDSGKSIIGLVTEYVDGKISNTTDYITDRLSDGSNGVRLSILQTVEYTYGRAGRLLAKNYRNPGEGLGRVQTFRSDGLVASESFYNLQTNKVNARWNYVYERPRGGAVRLKEILMYEDTGRRSLTLVRKLTLSYDRNGRETTRTFYLRVNGRWVADPNFIHQPG